MNAKHTRWIADECPDASGHTTIRPADGSANGDTDAQPIATVYVDDAVRLIAAAPAMEDELREVAHGLRWAGEHGYIETLDWELYCKRIDALLARIDGE